MNGNGTKHPTEEAEPPKSPTCTNGQEDDEPALRQQHYRFRKSMDKHLTDEKWPQLVADELDWTLEDVEQYSYSYLAALAKCDATIMYPNYQATTSTATATTTNSNISSNANNESKHPPATSSATSSAENHTTTKVKSFDENHASVEPAIGIEAAFEPPKALNNNNSSKKSSSVDVIDLCGDDPLPPEHQQDGTKANGTLKWSAPEKAYLELLIVREKRIDHTVSNRSVYSWEERVAHQLEGRSLEEVRTEIRRLQRNAQIMEADFQRRRKLHNGGAT